MKSNSIKILSLLLAVLSLVLLVACDNFNASELWQSATYGTDTTLGNGAKTVRCDIEIEDRKVTITLNSDKDTLGSALYEYKLINDPVFFDTLNGMKADWSKHKAHWAFYQGEKLMECGVNDAKINGGEHFRFVYTK